MRGYCNASCGRCTPTNGAVPSSPTPAASPSPDPAPPLAATSGTPVPEGVPDYFDWQEQNKVTPVKDQGDVSTVVIASSHASSLRTGPCDHCLAEDFHEHGGLGNKQHAWTVVLVSLLCSATRANAHVSEASCQF
jgi:hypothetical protein